MKEKFLTFYFWAVCGYSERSRCSTFTRGYRIDRTTRRGAFVLWLLDLDTALRYSPSTFRWWLADQLARAAMRLRGEKVTVFGFYDCARGNRAAALVESIRNQFITETRTEELGEQMAELNPKLDELASCCGATWMRNRQPPEQENAGTQRPGTPDGSLATEMRKPGSLK